MVTAKKRFIVILADGARYDSFRDLLELGQLPHISEEFLDRGTFAMATSVFPSTTGPAYMPFLTGCFPGTCNVPGIRWFDKQLYHEKKFSLKRFRSYVGLESYLMNKDMNPELKTLFDYFSKSFNIFSSVNRGVSKAGNLASYMRIWFWYYAHLTDRWHMVDDAALEKTLSVIQKDFEFLFVVFPGIDEYSHLSFPKHPEAIQAYKKIDFAIGKMARELKKEQKYDETAIFIVSDHGLSETKSHFGVASFLEEKGIRTFYYPKIFKWGFQAATMVSGNAMLHLYFKGREGWGERLSVQEIQEAYPTVFEELLSELAVDLILAKEKDDSVMLINRRGTAKIKEQEGRYQITLQGDPFSGLRFPSEYISSSETLRLTADSKYPDVIVQACQIFRSSRTGDLVLSASPGYDLRKRFEHPEHKSSHGAMHREHMLIPMFSNVKMQREIVRSVDLFPSILQLNGVAIPLGIDGETFF